ncbi:UPF0182 family protein [Lysinimonas soli]|uniref:UPF0182 protein ACFPJ4_02175 n=1 Tax=Lysinimonas soli TaxID=1074233 RepID=A0ABW0NLY1_9MICO
MTSSTASRPQRPPRNRTRAAFAITAAVIAALVIAFFIFSGLYADVLWYDQIGYLKVLTTQWAATAAMFGVGFVAMALPVWLSIFIAFRARPVYAKLNSQLDRYQQVIEPLRRLAMYGIPVVLGLFMGVSTATRWPTVLQFLNRTSFGTKDPQFHLDVSFYVYELPFYRGVVAYASAAVIIAGLAALATNYLYGGIRITGREVRISRPARIQLALTAAIYLGLQAVSIWFDQYSTLTDSTSIGTSVSITGAGFTDVNATIPSRVILAGIAAFVALLAVVTAIIGRWRLPLIGTALLIVSSIVIGSIYPAIVQNFQVNPSAQTLESKYIDRSISATRDAYGVNGVKTVQYNATTDVQAGQLRADAETAASIRILDPALVSKTFAQLQQVRQYYQFSPHLDVDRYKINGTTQDTVIAVRELDSANQSSNSWYNDTLVYTHGFGVVAAYGNQRTSNGQPKFLESDIPPKGSLGSYQPRIYFGEQSPGYSIVGAPKGSKNVEFDYPSGGGTTASDASTDGATTTYSGNGGPKLDSFLKKLVYAIKFQSQEIVFSSAVTNDSQILYDRDPKARVTKVAPYLTLDSDPYPAVVNGRVVWIVDGYTTTADYPYSRVQQLSNTIVDTYTPQPDYALDDVNYIRNSVKATVDAYSGKVTLYAWDTTDPILKTWQKIFPATIKPASAMSTELTAHVRYPADLFKVQRSILQTYHVTDAASFYQGVDAWSVPNDPTQPKSTAKAQPPYYLTMQVPGTKNSAFTLYSTYIPKSSSSSSRSVLTGYLAVDSDAGPNYGKMTLLTLPKQATVPGPGQVQNTFDSDPTVSTQLNLLRQGQTDVVYGNLLTLPVGGGLLYVQPVYVQSSANADTSYPLLRKVLVAFGDKIAFEDTLNAALDSLFGGNSGASAGDNGAAGTGSGTSPGTGTGSGTTTGTQNAALKKALSDYQAALARRQAAYATNDLVAAAQADQQMQDAIKAAIAAEGN